MITFLLISELFKLCHLWCYLNIAPQISFQKHLLMISLKLYNPTITNCNTRFSGIRTKKTKNKWGEWSLLCNGVHLHNRYLAEAATGTQFDLVAGLWVINWWTVECICFATLYRPEGKLTMSLLVGQTLFSLWAILLSLCFLIFVLLLSSHILS